MKKIIPLLSMSSLLLVACGSGEPPETDTTEEVSEDTTDEPTQEELNAELKAEAEQIDFVTANSGDYEEGTRVYAEGTVDTIFDDGVLHNFTLTTEEGEGYGMYAVEGFNTTDTEFSEGDAVRVYGTYGGRSESGFPLISMTIIEQTE